MDPQKFYLALYRIGRYVESTRGCIQKEDFIGAMPHLAEISELANRLYRALDAANNKMSLDPAAKVILKNR